MILRNLVVAAALGTTALAGNAQPMGMGLSNLGEMQEIAVNVDNVVRAATEIEIEIGKNLALSGGVNKIIHPLMPTPMTSPPWSRGSTR